MIAELVDDGPPRLDGSDKFFGMENVGRPNSTFTPSLVMGLEVVATSQALLSGSDCFFFCSEVVLMIVGVIGREWGKIWEHLVGPRI